MNNKISLTIIVKNAEKTLEKTFQSVISFVDEIIIIDTGSTDNTKDICMDGRVGFQTLPYNTALEIQLFETEWKNDFSLVRNMAIEHATGDWILILDSDEYISEEDGHKIKESVKDNKTGAYIFTQESSKESSKASIVSSIRLFRKLPHIRYRYAIHEIIDTSELKRQNLEIKNLNVKIKHSGYETNEKLKQKEKRNLNILKSKLIKETLDDEEYFHYGVNFLRISLKNSPKSYLEKTIGNKLINIKDVIFNRDLFNISQDFFVYFTVIPEFLFKYSEYEKIDQIFYESIKIYPSSPYLYFRYAEIYYKAEQYDKSIELFESCLDFNNSGYNGELLFLPEILGSLTYYALSKCYEATGDIEKAKKYFELSKN